MTGAGRTPPGGGDTTSEGGGPPYYWNTVTNAVQYKPPADPSAAPPDSVHDVLLHSSAWKGW